LEDLASRFEKAEKGRGVELAVLSEEGAVADEAAEGGAHGGGADEVVWVVDVAEDVQQELFGDRRPWRGLAPMLEDG
jgi:hypothetical protein